MTRQMHVEMPSSATLRRRLGRRRRQRPSGAFMVVAAGVAAIAFALGTLVPYLFDPALRRRRSLARDRAAHLRRELRRSSRRNARRMRANVTGQARRAIHRVQPHHPPPDDVTLAHRVESEIYRDPTFPKGRLSITAEHDGTVILRGALPSDDDIRRLVAAVEQVPGVELVHSLLHLEGTDAPNKADALRTVPGAANGHGSATAAANAARPSSEEA